MSWSDAQTYCRSKYTDLSTVRSLEDNKDIASLLQSLISLKDLVPAAWIGLHRNFWMWSDASNASYSSWADKQPDMGGSKDCVKMKIDDHTADWSTESCSNAMFFICYSDVRVSALRSVKVRLSGGSVELNDPALQDAILLQLQQKLEAAGIREEVKLRWRKQPDGKVFHRAPPTGWEEEPGIHI
ncbi:regenerating islet-derived protein 4-like [Perca flavescens]|uniref:regenerating islet-derived protein 4-like n=1 Tax=Perca flavescens TaxID=8167 RepID=UPI00106EB653|nr:regenerating islet-derived protein 4-like [Perca flavescens]